MVAGGSDGLQGASVSELVAIARGRRRELGLSQAAVAHRAGVSRKWVHEFELGKPGAELGLTLRLLAALDLDMDIRRREQPRADGLKRGILDDVLSGVERRAPR